MIAVFSHLVFLERRPADHLHATQLTAISLILLASHLLETLRHVTFIRCVVRERLTAVVALVRFDVQVFIHVSRVMTFRYERARTDLALVLEGSRDVQHVGAKALLALKHLRAVRTHDAVAVLHVHVIHESVFLGESRRTLLTVEHRVVMSAAMSDHTAVPERLKVAVRALPFICHSVLELLRCP